MPNDTATRYVIQRTDTGEFDASESEDRLGIDWEPEVFDAQLMSKLSAKEWSERLAMMDTPCVVRSVTLQLGEPIE